MFDVPPRIEARQSFLRKSTQRTRTDCERDFSLEPETAPGEVHFRVAFHTMGRKWSWKWGLGVLASFLFALWHDAVAEIDFLCPLCGEGKEMTIPNGIVTIPQNPSFGCAELDGLAAQGSIDQQTCGVLETFAQEPCGCEASLDGNATAAPVGTPITVPPSPSTVGPTFGSEPECYDDLDNIRQRELALSSDALAVGRTYVLCPGAVFLMGRAIPGGFEGGFEAITPRPNVHYKCGAYGSSADSCRLLYGDYAIISAGGGDPQHTNVTFEGLTIESSVTAGVVAVMPGDLTFVDCIFKVRMLSARAFDVRSFKHSPPFFRHRITKTVAQCRSFLIVQSLDVYSCLTFTCDNNMGSIRILEICTRVSTVAILMKKESMLDIYRARRN